METHPSISGFNHSIQVDYIYYILMNFLKLPNFGVMDLRCRDRKFSCLIKNIYFCFKSLLFQVLCFWMMWCWVNDFGWTIIFLYKPFWIYPKQNVSQTCSLSVYEFCFVFIGSRNCQIYFMRRIIWRLWESLSLWISRTLHYELSEVLFLSFLCVNACLTFQPHLF